MIFFSGFILLLLFFTFPESAWSAGEAASGLLSIRQEVERESLEEAMRSFESGDYRRAKITFEILSEGAQSPEVKDKALFALAAVKLVLARAEEDFVDAVSAWERWSSQAQSPPACDDPRMLTPFLRRLEPKAQAGAKSSKEAQGRRSTSKDLGSFKGMLHSKEKEVETLRSRIELRDREIRRLRHQLESLEAIHRKYQEKKQESAQ